jgi:hypothetical protein
MTIIGLSLIFFVHHMMFPHTVTEKHPSRISVLHQFLFFPNNPTDKNRSERSPTCFKRSTTVIEHISCEAISTYLQVNSAQPVSVPFQRRMLAYTTPFPSPPLPAPQGINNSPTMNNFPPIGKSDARNISHGSNSRRKCLTGFLDHVSYKCGRG